MENEISLLRQQIEDLKAENLWLRRNEDEAVYRSLFENNHAVMLLIDPETAAIKDANLAACAYYGWSRKQLKALRIDEINTLSREEVFAQMQLARAEKRRNFFFRHRRADGSIRDVEVYSGPLTVKGQTLLYSIIHDITDRKLVENALRESEDKYNQIVESLADAILVWFDEGIIYANPAAFKLFRANPEGDLIGKRYLDLVHPDDRPESAERIKKSKNEKWIAPGREHRMITTDGQVIHVESTGVPVQSQGRILHFGIFRDISERKRAEEELRLDDQRIEALLKLNQMTQASLQEIASFAMEEAVRLTQSRIGYLAFANEDESVLTMYAWSRSAMSECAIEQKPLVYPVASTGLWGETVRQRNAVITNDYQAPNPLKKGFPKGHLNLRRHLGVPIFDNDRIVIVAGVGDKASDYNERDIKQLELLMSGMWRIVQRKQAEDALRHSEARFRTTFENASVGITLVSLEGIYLEVNEAFARTLGYRPEDLIGKSVVDFTHPSDLDGRSRFLSDLISGRISSGEQQRRLIHRDGSYVWALIVASVQRDLDGTPLYFISLVQDITKRKQAEENLRETEKKYRELAESLPQVIFEIDSLGSLIYLNKIGHEVFGYTSEELANGFNVLDAFIPEDRERVARDIILNVQGQRLGQREYTAVKKDGTKFPIAVHANRIMREQTAVGVRGILIDLTSIKAAEKDRKKLEAQLQQAQKMEAIGSLAGGIAHDFNNILSVIIGNAELMKMTDISFSGSDEVDQILSASKRAKDLVRQILAFSRQGEQKKILMSLKPVIKETIEFLRASIPSTIQLQHDIRPDIGSIMADPTQMQQVLMNLCTNAAQAMEKEGGVLRIELDNFQPTDKDEVLDPETEPGPYLRIAVSDTGPGISKEMLPRIFDPYFTTKGPDKGTGLGLAVVHGIVRSHGGVVKIYSEVGKGTVFHVLLPRADGAVRKEEKPEQGLPIGTERILVVDDEIHLLEMYKRMLGHLGYQVDIRTSPVEAIEALRSNPLKYHLLITDMTMPQMNGHNLAKKIMEIRPGLPVILCTGFSDQINEEKARSTGIRAFLLKPVLFHDLASTLRKTLDEAKREDAVEQ